MLQATEKISPLVEAKSCLRFEISGLDLHIWPHLLVSEATSASRWPRRSKSSLNYTYTRSFDQSHNLQ